MSSSVATMTGTRSSSTLICPSPPAEGSRGYPPEAEAKTGLAEGRGLRQAKQVRVPQAFLRDSREVPGRRRGAGGEVRQGGGQRHHDQVLQRGHHDQREGKDNLLLRSIPRLRRQDYLPKVLAVLHADLRVLRPAHGHRDVHDGPEPPLLEELQDPEQLPAPSHVAAEYRDLLGEDVPDVGRRVVTGGRAARHDPASPGDRPQALLPRRLPGVLDDDVDALSLGVLPRLLRDLLRAVVDRVVRAELDGLPELRLAPRSRDHVRIVGFRYLDRCDPHSRPGPQHEDRLARLDPRLGHKHVIRRQERQGHGRSLDEVHPLRLWKKVPQGRDDELRVSAVHLVPDDRVSAALVVVPAEAPLAPPAPDPRAHDHFGPLSQRLLLRRDLLYHPRDVAPGDVRQGGLGVRRAYPAPDVKAVQSARLHPNQRLLLALRRWVGRVLVLQHLGSAVPMESYGLHASP